MWCTFFSSNNVFFNTQLYFYMHYSSKGFSLWLRFISLSIYLPATLSFGGGWTLTRCWSWCSANSTYKAKASSLGWRTTCILILCTWCSLQVRGLILASCRKVLWQLGTCVYMYVTQLTQPEVPWNIPCRAFVHVTKLKVFNSWTYTQDLYT